jgi:hypothetical protein
MGLRIAIRGICHYLFSSAVGERHDFFYQDTETVKWLSGYCGKPT